jgi:hypothetical protein
MLVAGTGRSTAGEEPELAARILKKSGRATGICLDLGCGTGRPPKGSAALKGAVSPNGLAVAAGILVATTDKPEVVCLGAEDRSRRQ